jgi:hypothetical protein
VAALIVVMAMPLGMIFWRIPQCDAIGVGKAGNRAARQSVPVKLAA